MKETISVKNAAMIAEKAYRRGFQHGVVYSEEMGITNEDATKFRYGVSYSKAWGAPEKDASGKTHNPWKGVEHSLIERHIKMEGTHD